MERRLDDNKKKGVWRSLDWWTILIYLALLAFGWISICGASYDFDMGGNIFDFDSRSGMQIVWIGTSLALGFILLMLDDKLYDTFAYVFYIILLVALFITPFLAHDIKGSHSWIKIGPFSFQSAEFAKCATAGCHDDLAGKKGTKSLYYVVHNKKDTKFQTCLQCHDKIVAEKPDLKKDLTGCAKSKCHP